MTNGVFGLIIEGEGYSFVVVRKMDFCCLGCNLDTSGSFKTKRKLEEIQTEERFRTLAKLVKEQREDEANDFLPTATVQYQPWMEKYVSQKF